MSKRQFTMDTYIGSGIVRPITREHVASLIRRHRANRRPVFRFTSFKGQYVISLAFPVAPGGLHIYAV